MFLFNVLMYVSIELQKSHCIYTSEGTRQGLPILYIFYYEINSVIIFNIFVFSHIWNILFCNIISNIVII